MKAWPFDGPVEIHETHGEREDVFLVDRWCLLEAYVIEAGKQCNFFDDISSTDSFNYDAYKVLARFLLSDSKQETEITVLC